MRFALGKIDPSGPDVIIQRSLFRFGLGSVAVHVEELQEGVAKAHATYLSMA